MYGGKDREGKIHPSIDMGTQAYTHAHMLHRSDTRLPIARDRARDRTEERLAEKHRKVLSFPNMSTRRHGEFRRVCEKKTNGLASDEWNKAGNAQGVHTESCARKNAGEIKKIRLSEISPGRETAPQKEASMANKEGRRQKRIRARGMCLCVGGIYEIPNSK